MRALKDSAAPSRGPRETMAGARLRIALAAALAAAAAGCGLDAPPPAQEVAAAETTPETAPERPAPETTWVRLAALGSNAPHVRRQTFRSAGHGFRVIVELREPTEKFATGRVITNVLSPRTTLPIRTLETRLPAQRALNADTTFVDAEPGEYTLFVLHDYGIRHWSVVAEAPRIRERPR